MAFQAPIPRPSLGAVTSDLWPSMSKLLNAPWKNAGHTAPQRTIATSTVCCSPSVDIGSGADILIPSQVPNTLPLPECLTAVSSEALNSSIFGTPLRSGWARSLYCEPTMWATPSLATHRLPSSSTRSYSTLTTPMNRLRPAPKVNGLSRLQQQRFVFGGPSHNLLAQKEKTATNNPNSANAQNAFYQALLRANMPSIVIERHNCGHFASNAVTAQLYTQALQRAGVLGPTSTAPGPNQPMSPEHLQTIGEAVATQVRNGKPASTATTQSGTGAKDAPLYVVVEESKTSHIFRWMKVLVWMVFLWYTIGAALQFLIETSGMLKNLKGAPTNEAQPQQQTVRFSDVHGCDEAKEELQELVEFLLNPERFSSLGGKLPKGVLLVGPPGTGKTLLARAVAGEAGVPFFYMSGSEFDEVYVGVGAKRVRELFTQARSKSPAIIFIDELDAIGARRNDKDAAYVKQTLNQLLTELDGFSQSTGVIIIAATNFPQLLDKALTRPGRFDRKVAVNLPDVRGRMDILKHHMKEVQISTDVDIAVIARGTPGFSGADLENLVNQAAVYASRNKKFKVGPKDFDWAKDRIIMGAESKSRFVQDKDKLKTAYHEAGHALVAYFSPASTPLYKITIIPRGMSLGSTHFLPEMDMVSKDYTEYLSDIDVSMGGRVAEELIYGYDKVTSGITADLQSATRTAFTLITQFGYSGKLGNVDLFTNYDSLSSETKQEIESEVRRLVEEARIRATNILTERRAELEILTQALIEYETLTKEEMEKVLKGEKLQKLEAPPILTGPLTLPEALQSPSLNSSTTADPQQPPTSSAGQSAEE
ncbi:intermembrane space AAA protease IAP-1 [Aspergillus heteromorphus CBS 117.55]|uniref:Intermembrane space AAA protease IAP-1 n=1 Tax=Aspergillus heteromorphus CBS 117.55 TaxID=1448321 RepID=A0A317WPJ9_9EURO|nr:intermembrane space AAA protease IAP-1 [Aspergillus heteromorphus CBS 117.55]PWY87581.1 intermembrane space AAA protease IAP-1 [Aspergillus heteromorphus CBS 117.55]